MSDKAFGWLGMVIGTANLLLSVMLWKHGAVIIAIILAFLSGANLRGAAYYLLKA